MTITISDEELKNFKSTLVLHYTAAIVDFFNEIEPFVDQNLKKKFEKEVMEARKRFHERLRTAPTIISI